MTQTMKRCGILLASTALALLAMAPVASAELGFEPGSFKADFFKPNSVVPYTQAGGHAFDQTTSFTFNTLPSGGPDGRVKNVFVDLPPGLSGIPTSVPACSIPEFRRNTNCRPETQVGIEWLTSGFGENPQSLAISIYNLEPLWGDVATVGFNFFNVITVIHLRVRSGSNGYHVGAVATGVSATIPVITSSATIWGIPADPSHDAERACPQKNPPGSGGPTCPTSAPRLPFLTNPSDCSGPLATSIAADSWESPGTVITESYTAAYGVTGCESVPFNPTISVQPTSREADSPTGLDVSLHLPQSESPDGIATAYLKDATVTLPEGMAINPSSAAGQGACSLDQIGMSAAGVPDETPVACPNDSKIGTLQIDSPALPDPVPGAIYLATQGTNPFNSTIATYLVAEDPERGLLIKLAGKLSPDPQTGRLTATFEDNPQLPFSQLRLSFFGGPRASLVNPPTCGTKTTAAQLTSWSRPEEPLTRTSGFAITTGPGGSACPSAPAAFEPKLNAGTASPVAGAKTPFSFKLTRGDGTQRFASLDVNPPPGLTAALRGVPYCPEAALEPAAASARLGALEAASPSCPAASRIGTVIAGTGAGPTPFYSTLGKAYLAGPYKGAPLSLAAVIPALAGPFDLNTVLVRSAIEVDPRTTRITVKSDPLPTILQGIPLNVRDIRVNVDRPNFTLNPTSCDPMEVGAVVRGTEGATANLSNRFQVGACGSLAFKPRLALRLLGPTHRSAHPRLRAVLKMPAGGANIARAAVTLPKTELLEQSHIRTICTRVQYAAEACPKGAIYGYARAWSPLLDQPLQGPVYLRSSNHTLPDLVASLDGQIHLDLVGRIDSVKSRLRTTFDAVPDAPVSKFVLTMQGGRKGLLVNNTELCRAKPRASVMLDGQNGKISDSNPLVKADCKRAKGKPHRGKR